jgi:cellulose biosynthesis protein BcsQ
MQNAAEPEHSQLILMDLGPNLGSINRAALIAADYVVVPLAPDLFSLQGLRNLGPAFFRWRRDWIDRVNRKPGIDIALPEGRMEPIGYVLHQHSITMDRPVKAYDRWINRIPSDYRTYVLSEDPASKTTVRDDPHCLALLKHYHSLMPMAQEARKPMFYLKPADGAIGAHYKSAQEAYRDFETLARTIAARIGLPIATPIETTLF